MGSYKDKLAKMPIFEEINNHFRVTLFGINISVEPTEEWEHQLINELSIKDALGTKDIANLWGITVRAARTRLQTMVRRGLIKRHAKSKNDPNANYSRM